MVRPESAPTSFASIAHKGICLLTSAGVIGALGFSAPAVTTAYAGEDDRAIETQSAQIDDPAAIVMDLVMQPTQSIVTRDDLLAFLAGRSIAPEGLLSVTESCLAAYGGEASQEILRLKSLLNQNPSPVSPEAPDIETQPSAPEDSDTENGEGSDLPPSDEVVPVPDGAMPSDSPTDTASGESGASAEGTGGPGETGGGSETPTVPDAAQPVCEDAVYPQWSYSGDTTVVVNPQAAFSNTTLIALLGEHMRDMCREKGLYASIVLAQVILDANAVDCAFEPFQSRVFAQRGVIVDPVEAALLNKGYDVSKKFRNRFDGCADMIEYLDGYTDFIAGTLPYVDYQAEAAMRLYEREVSETEGDDASSFDTLGFSFDVTPRATDAAEADAHDEESVVTTREYTLEEIEGVYAEMLDEIPLTYQQACLRLEEVFGCEAGYAEKLLETIDRYDLSRYDAPRQVRTAEPVFMPARDGDGAYVVDEETGSVIFEERSTLDLMDEIVSHLGEPYVWGGTTPGAFDCSGLVQYAYATALGIDIPRTTYYQCLLGEDVDFRDLQPGDLVFFADAKGVCVHVGIYAGEGCYVEAPRTGEVVRVTSMADKTPTFAKRIIPSEETTCTLTVTRQRAADGDEGETEAEARGASGLFQHSGFGILGDAHEGSFGPYRTQPRAGVVEPA